MKRLALFLVLFLGCGSTGVMSSKPTVGQEICQTACKLLGGKYHDMTEDPRTCFCKFEMPSYTVPNMSSQGTTKPKEGLDI